MRTLFMMLLLLPVNYLVITRDFATRMEGRESCIHQGSFFHSAITVDSLHVCSMESLTDFPEEFDSFISNPTVITLDITQFPRASH